jgi:hypothetical protein
MHAKVSMNGFKVVHVQIWWNYRTARRHQIVLHVETPISEETSRFVLK